MAYRADLYCKYHQCLGHSTYRCTKLRYYIQDLVDNKIISPPLANPLNITKNPLPNHYAMPPSNNVNFVEVGEGKFDPSELIVSEEEVVRPCNILEMREIFILREEEELSIEVRVEKLEFEHNLTK